MQKTKRLRAIAAVLAIVIGCGVFAQTETASAAVPAPPGVDLNQNPPPLVDGRFGLLGPTAAPMSVPSSTAIGVAYGTAVTSRCPSTNTSYYTSRGWAVCLWGTEPAWAASLYVCTAGMGKYRDVQWYAMEACQSHYILQSSAVAFGLKYYYMVELYKWAVWHEDVRALIEFMTALYIDVFEFYGIGRDIYLGSEIVCGTISAASLGVAGWVAFGVGVACGYAWSYVRRQVFGF